MHLKSSVFTRHCYHFWETQTLNLISILCRKYKDVRYDLRGEGRWEKEGMFQNMHQCGESVERMKLIFRKHDNLKAFGLLLKLYRKHYTKNKNGGWLCRKGLWCNSNTLRNLNWCKTLRRRRRRATLQVLLPLITTFVCIQNYAKVLSH